MRRLLWEACFVLSCFFVHVLSTSTPPIPRKHLAGPPEEFERHQLPQPQAGALFENTAYIDIHLTPHPFERNRLYSVTELRVDSRTKFGFSFFSPIRDYLTLTLSDPTGAEVDLRLHSHNGSFPIGGASVPETSFLFHSPKVGIWTLEVISLTLSASFISKTQRDQIPEAAVILWNESPLRVYTHLNTYDLLIGQRVGLVSHITTDPEISAKHIPTPLREIITEAEMEVSFPDGSNTEVKMYDDGLHNDRMRADGSFGALVLAKKVGLYRVQAVIKGTINNVPFMRTTQHLINVVQGGVLLTNSSNGVLKDWETMNIFINIVVESKHIGRELRAFAEVWGKDEAGNDMPVCWIGGITNIEEDKNGNLGVNLELNMRWVSRAKARGFNGICASFQNIRMEEITKEMRVGKFPEHLLSRSKRRDYKGGSLVLVHGYCATENPWKTYIGWTDAEFFLQPYSNMGNEEFARKIYIFAERERLGTFGIIAHSQGGMASVHLLNYYFTGLDLAIGERVIQSVGTPYRGCTAAGSAASLGILFGIGCGANWDLSTDGAEMWLAGISSVHQKDVWYYTTTYSMSVIGDYCSLATNFILRWPNDGTAELDHTNLPGAHYLGNTERWCHTSNMNYPPQYWDDERNNILNTLAAR